MRANLTKMIQRARLMRDIAEAEREDAVIMRESAATLVKMAQDVRKQIRRQLAEAGQ